MVQKIIRPSLDTTAVQDAIDSAFAALNLTPGGIGAEPAGAVQSAIASLGDIATQQDVEAAIAVQEFTFPPLLNFWRPSGLSALKLQKQNNIVFLSGTLLHPDFLSQDSLIGILPLQCRPSSLKIILVPAVAEKLTGETIVATDAIRIDPDGSIYGSVLTDNNPLKMLTVFLDISYLAI